jgi:hypothetical protein
VRGEDLMDQEQIISKTELYNERFFYDEPFYRRNMSAEEFRREKIYLNENMDAFWDGSYIPLWRQDILRKREAFQRRMKGQNY